MGVYSGHRNVCLLLVNGRALAVARTAACSQKEKLVRTTTDAFNAFRGPVFRGLMNRVDTIDPRT